MFNYETLQIFLQEGAGDVIQPDMEGHVKRWRGKKRIDYGENNLLYRVMVAVNLSW